ncbi:arylsulfatase [Paraflavitalea sp. CAU 1676]|uniref:arylsulfatase n=1 Tax=Paraflavitalea sp. CAU 1676 TaxID=3032598 RepID=UPI0023DC4C2A|nr:arylsulfatase [Paraflavitalea sp. CAU 1676]MDF2187990.1 arylsulfatase [Paraflavitalea sp. CAU 1676]
MKKILISCCWLWLPFLSTAQQKPNIVLIMTDDMGFSDIGCYGSEIPTPNIDQLASKGIRFSQFYNTAKCCPTRASLMTGLFPHQTGVGHMSEDPESRQQGKDSHDWGTPGYRGYLNRHNVTIAEVLRTAGYHTYMAGKWHLGMHEKEKWPLQRGFDQFYGILSGAASYLKPQGGRGLWRNNEHLPTPADSSYYTTDAFTSNAIDFVQQQQDDKPFFLYLAFNAPHWPLQAKKEDIDLFRDKYKAGWDRVRAQRHQRQLARGVIRQQPVLSGRDTGVRAWDQLTATEQEKVAYRMAVYAAQVKCVDDNVGRLIAALKARNQFDNTLIIFLSDNGACAEAYQELGSMPDARINDPDFAGMVSYGMGWANVSNTPFRKWKNRMEEGGMAAPFIVHWPKGISKGNRIVTTPAYLIDIMPTVLAVTGATYPTTFHGGEVIYPLTGFSLQPAFRGKSLQQHEYMYWEHEDNAAIRKGNWKAIYSLTKNTWALYDLSDSRTEDRDWSPEQPVLLEELKAKWFAWAKDNFVLPKRAGQ